jgi:hypothetical protein
VDIILDADVIISGERNTFDLRIWLNLERMIDLRSPLSLLLNFGMAWSVDPQLTESAGSNTLRLL